MKKILLSLAVVATSMLGSSCQTGPNAQLGTGVGALAGAVGGGIIGHQSGRGLEGAAIGAVAGGAAGNMIGGSQDARNAQRYQQQPYYNNQPQYNQPYYNNQPPYQQGYRY